MNLHIFPRNTPDVCVASEVSPQKHVTEQEGFGGQQKAVELSCEKKALLWTHVSCPAGKVHMSILSKDWSSIQLSAFSFNKSLSSLFSWKD